MHDRMTLFVRSTRASLSQQNIYARLHKKRNNINICDANLLIFIQIIKRKNKKTLCKKCVELINVSDVNVK